MTEKKAQEVLRMVELTHSNRMWRKLEEAKIFYGMQSDGCWRYCLRIVRMQNGRGCECLLDRVKVISIVTNVRITMCVADERTIIICGSSEIRVHAKAANWHGRR